MFGFIKNLFVGGDTTKERNELKELFNPIGDFTQDNYEKKLMIISTIKNYNICNFISNNISNGGIFNDSTIDSLYKLTMRFLDIANKGLEGMKKIYVSTAVDNLRGINRENYLQLCTDQITRPVLSAINVSNECTNFSENVRKISVDVYNASQPAAKPASSSSQPAANQSSSAANQSSKNPESSLEDALAGIETEDKQQSEIPKSSLCARMPGQSSGGGKKRRSPKKQMKKSPKRR
jgi:hypothetical protein